MKFSAILALTSALILASCAGATDSGNGPKEEETQTHDGALGQPQELPWDSPFSGKVGRSTQWAEAVSYYKFTVPADRTIVLIAVNTSTPAHDTEGDYRVRLFSDANGTQEVGTTDDIDDHIAPYAKGLTPGATYYLEVENGQDAAATYHVAVQPEPLYKHDGSETQPAILSMLPGTVVTSGFPGEDSSYYQFAASATGTATIRYSEPFLDGQIFESVDFTATPLAEEHSNYAKSFTVELTQGTTYYLKIRNWDMGTRRVTGPVTITF